MKTKMLSLMTGVVMVSGIPVVAGPDKGHIVLPETKIDVCEQHVVKGDPSAKRLGECKAALVGGGPATGCSQLLDLDDVCEKLKKGLSKKLEALENKGALCIGEDDFKSFDENCEAFLSGKSEGKEDYEVKEDAVAAMAEAVQGMQIVSESAAKRKAALKDAGNFGMAGILNKRDTNKAQAASGKVFEKTGKGIEGGQDGNVRAGVSRSGAVGGSAESAGSPVNPFGDDPTQSGRSREVPGPGPGPKRELHPTTPPPPPSGEGSRMARSFNLDGSQGWRDFIQTLRDRGCSEDSIKTWETNRGQGKYAGRTVSMRAGASCQPDVR